MNRHELVTAAQEKGASLNITESFESTDGYLHIGVCLKNTHRWYWFYSFDNDFMIFDHVYSMNTGKVRKSISNKLSIMKRLGF